MTATLFTVWLLLYGNAGQITLKSQHWTQASCEARKVELIKGGHRPADLICPKLVVPEPVSK